MDKLGSLKITTLAENLVQAGGLGQWGLSFLLELVDGKGDQRKVLFDTGGHKEGFLNNMKLLEVDFSDLDAVVISHGHWDHTAATVEAVQETGGVKVFAHPLAFYPHISVNREGKMNDSGIPVGERAGDIEAAGGELVLSSKPVEVVLGLWTTGEVERITSFEGVAPPRKGAKRYYLVDGEEVPCFIQDDMAIWADIENVGPYAITGCAHSGPINTLLHVKKLGDFQKISGFIGGTHLGGRSDEYLNKTIHEFGKFGLQMLSPCHCTGFKATALLMNAFPEEFVLNYCCRELTAGKMPRYKVR